MGWTGARHSCEAVCSPSADLCQTLTDAQRGRGPVAAPVSLRLARPGRLGGADGRYCNHQETPASFLSSTRSLPQSAPGTKNRAVKSHSGPPR